MLSVIVDYNVLFWKAPTSNKYVKDKQIAFIISSRLISAAKYRFKDLVEDITSRCTTPNWLNETTIGLRNVLGQSFAQL